MSEADGSAARTLRRRIRVAGIVALVGVAALAVFLFWEHVFPCIWKMDTTAFEKNFPATIFRDRNGEILHTERGFDHAARFPVSIENLPKHFVEIVLVTEDRRFFEHDGVDVLAALRAGMQLVFGGHVVSGASTVTMQLVASADGRSGRSFARKIVQMGKARNLERVWSKEKILEEYLNRLPYGGTVYGIEAAARYYFGRPAKDLNVAESVLLAGIPQRPSRFRPDRFPDAAKKRQERVLKMLVRQGFFSEEEAAAVRAQPLRFRDFTSPVFPRAADPQFFQWIKKKLPAGKNDWTTTLDPAIQRIVAETVSRAARESFGVRDGAAIVVENRTRAVRAFLGTLDFRSSDAGQVNAATARRSPGSLLKPFFYGEAVDGGLLVAETMLDDSPLQIADYRPGNFYGTFRGRVPARVALADSLNTPAVRVLREIGVGRAIATLGAFGIFPDTFEKNAARDVGLSLALGGAETSAVEIAEAYATLANGGRSAPLRFLENDSGTENFSEEILAEKIWHDGVAEMILEMLRERRLPGAETLDVAWKTGTSNGLRDAWCAAVTPEWTVVVWFGNKSGAPAPALVGVELAAPIAGKILSVLYRGRVPDEWSRGEFFCAEKLCAETGLAAGEFCENTRDGTVVARIPLRRCDVCAKKNRAENFSGKTKIVAPRAGIYRVPDGASLKIILRSVPARAHWYLDGRYLGTIDSGTAIELSPGKHLLFAWGGEKFSGEHLEIDVRPAN